VGADLSVTGNGLDDVVRAVSAVPGVRAVVPAFRDDTAILSPGGGQPTPVVVLALDPADYASARAGGTSADDVADLRRLSSTPTPDGTVPALVAPTGGTYSGPATLTLAAGLGQVGVEVIGTSTAVPAPGTSTTPVLLVSAAALAEAVPGAPPHSPDQLLVMAEPAAAEKVAAGLDATLHVTLRADVLADLDAQPLVTGTRAILRLGVLVAAGYALLTVTLTLIAGARDRGRLLSVLRTLGLRRRSARLLLAAELAPLVVLAVVSGAAAGLALLPATAPALDLRPYTGGQAEPALAVEPAQVLALAAATAVLVTVAAVATVLLDRRRQLGDALRVGGTP
jgi:putative ABC transport system permease protein